MVVALLHTIYYCRMEVQLTMKIHLRMIQDFREQNPMCCLKIYVQGFIPSGLQMHMDVTPLSPFRISIMLYQQQLHIMSMLMEMDMEIQTSQYNFVHSNRVMFRMVMIAMTPMTRSIPMPLRSAEIILTTIVMVWLTRAASRHSLLQRILKPLLAVICQMAKFS